MKPYPDNTKKEECVVRLTGGEFLAESDYVTRWGGSFILPVQPKVSFVGKDGKERMGKLGKFQKLSDTAYAISVEFDDTDL